MFVDNWNAITWSVVDYFRRPKKGYDVLKTVYQPVLIGMDLEREKISLNEIISFSNIWIINDTMDKYESTYAEICLFKDKEIVMEKKIEIGYIPSDTVKHFSNPHLSEELMNLNLKEKGKYVIKIELIDNTDNIISKNSYKIEVV
jgi:beta-mannosidase